MNILPAEYFDLPAILELQKICYQENAERYQDAAIPPMTQTLEALQQEFQTQLILKMTEAGKIIGSLRAYEEQGTCRISRVIVHPEFQNQGLGKRLMREVETRFPKARRFELFTGFKDEKNLRFYASLGYKAFKEETHGNVRFVFLEKRRETQKPLN